MAVKKNLEKVSNEIEKTVEKIEENFVSVELKNHPSGNHTVYTEVGTAIFVEGKALVSSKLAKVLKDLGIV